MKTITFGKKCVYGFFFAIMLCFSIGGASAATRTWSGIGGDGNWQTTNNWDSIPLAGDVLTFTGLNQLANTNNFTAGTQFNGIIFNAAAGSFILDGNAIKLAGPITNVSANAQVINLGLTNTTAVAVHCETNVTLAGIVKGGATLTKTGPGKLILNNSGIALNVLNLNGGTVDLTSDFTLGPANYGGTTLQGTGGTITSSGGRILIGGGSGANAADWFGGSSSPIIIEAPIANGLTAYNNIDYYNSGDLILRGANTYTGGTGFQGTRVQVGVDCVGSVGAVVSGPFGTGPLDFAYGHMSSDGITPRTILNAINFTGTMELGSTNLTGKLTFNSAVNLTGGTRTLTANSEVQFNGALTNGGFYKAGTATVTLAGANTYAGGTTISTGRLVVTGSILDTGAFTLNGPTAIYTVDTALKVGALTLTDGTIDGSGFVTGTSYTVSSGLITPSLGGSGTLTKTGAGTVTLAGANTYAGGTTINAGRLIITGSILDTGAFTLNGPTAIYTVDTALKVGALTLTDGTIDGSGFVTGTSYTVSSGLISANLGGNAILTKTGAGQVTLSGANTYTATVVNAGVLLHAKTNALYNGDTGSWTKEKINVASGGTLAFNVGGPNEFTVEQLSTLRSNLTMNINTNGLRAGSLIGFDTSNFPGGNFTLTESIGNSTGLGAGSLGISKLGSNTLTLAAANTYTGETLVNKGVLKAGHASALAAGTTLTATGTGILDLNGYTFTVTNLGAGGTGGTITDNATGTGTNTLTATAFSTVGMSARLADGPTRVLALTIANGNSAPTFGNNANTFSGGLKLKSISGSWTRLAVSAIPVNSGTAGAIVSSPFGRGPITIGETAADKAQIYYTAANGTILNDIVFNTILGTDQTAAIRLDNTLTLSGTLMANLAPVNMSAYVNATGGQKAYLTGRIMGPGTNGGLLLKNGNAVNGEVVTLNNQTGTPNDYAGYTSIESYNTLMLGASNQIPDGLGKGDVYVYGKLNLNGFNETINGLYGNGVVDGGGGTATLTVGGNNASISSFLGVITNSTGTLTVVKTGSGTMSLATPLRHSGSVVVENGTLRLSCRVPNASAPVAGMARWFDASSPDYVMTNAVGAVTNWIDRSGNNAHAVNTTGARLPLYAQNTLNGLPTVKFNSAYGNDTGDYLKFTRDTAIRTVFAVFKGESFLLTDGSAYNFHRPTDNDANINLWASYVPDSIKKDGKTYVNSTLVDGTTYGMPAVANNGFNLVTVQSTTAVIADSFNKDRTYHSGKQSHAEVLIYDRALTEGERIQVEGYLTSKWLKDIFIPTGTTITVLSGGVLDLNGQSQEVAMLKGNGIVSNGTLVVANAIDLTNNVAQSTAMSGNLTLKPGAALRIDKSVSGSDLVAVQGALTIQGANTVHLNTLAGVMPPFRVTLFTFGTISGAENLSSWTVELPPSLQNYKTRFHAENNEVSVSVFLSGTIIQFK